MGYTYNNMLCEAAVKMDGEKDKVFDMYYTQEKSIVDIAEFYNTNRGVVQYFFKVNNMKFRNKIPKRKYKISYKTKRIRMDADNVADMFLKEHFSVSSIAEKYDVSKSTVRNILSEKCVDINSKQHHKASEFAWRNTSKIIKMYLEKHMSAVVIGKIFGVSSNTIARILIANDVDMRKGSKRQSVLRAIDDYDILVKLYNEGNSYKKIANDYRVSDTTIRNIINKKGVYAE